MFESINYYLVFKLKNSCTDVKSNSTLLLILQNFKMAKESPENQWHILFILFGSNRMINVSFYKI